MARICVKVEDMARICVKVEDMVLMWVAIECLQICISFCISLRASYKHLGCVLISFFSWLIVS